MADIPGLATNIHKTSTVLGRIADATLQESYGQGISQFKIVWMLSKHPEGVLQTTIANWLNQTEAAVSRQVAILKREGLISKRVDPNNRRNHMIALTSNGKAFAEDAMQALVKAYKPCFKALSQTEQTTLNALLEKLFSSAVGCMNDADK